MELVHSGLHPLSLCALNSNDSSRPCSNHIFYDSAGYAKSVVYTTKREKPAYESVLSGTRNLTDTHASSSEHFDDIKEITTRQKPQISPVMIITNTESKRSHKSPRVSPVLDMSTQKTINLLKASQKPLFVSPTPVLSTPETINELEGVQKKNTVSVQPAVISTIPKTTNLGILWKKSTSSSPPLTPKTMNVSEKAVHVGERCIAD